MRAEREGLGRCRGRGAAHFGALPCCAAVLSACMLATGCARRDVSGTYVGSNLAGKAVLELRAVGPKLTGTARWDNREAVLDGTLQGDTATGTMRTKKLGLSLPFEAKFQPGGELVDVIYTMPATPFSKEFKVSVSLRKQAPK